MNIISKLWNKYKIHIIYILIIFLLCTILSSSIKRCSNVSNEYKHNIEALNDTIKYYQDKNGNLVATKLAFESDINTLKILNKSLYNQIDSLKIKKNNVSQIVYVSGTIQNPKQDTTYIVMHDTISNGFTKDFNFNNQYRELEGNVSYNNDSLGINILKDLTYFDYAVVMSKDNKIYIKSTNPYVRYNEISGFTLTKEKTKYWSLDAFANYNYSPNKNFNYLDIGLSINFNIKNISIGPQIYLEHDFLENKKNLYIGGTANLNILKW